MKEVFLNGFYTNQKDILVDEEWINSNDKKIFKISNIDISFHRQGSVSRENTYRINMCLTSFEGYIYNVVLYKDLNETTYKEDVIDYIYSIFKEIKY